MRPSLLLRKDNGKLTGFTDRAVPRQRDEDQHLSIHFLLCRPWFERLWVLQEIYLADQKAAIVACGHQTIPWSTFRRAWAYSYIKPTRPNFKHALDFRHRSYVIQHVVFHFGHSQCADPRDRIFAVVSLEPSLRELGIVPDYTSTRTHLDVYEDIARRLLNHHRGIRILSECDMSSPLPSMRTDSSTPSWVPDWSTGDLYAQSLSVLDRYTSGCLTGPLPQIENDQLRVLAIPIDIIEGIHSHSLQRTSTEEEALSVIRELSASLDLIQDYRSGDSMLEAYASTLVTGVYSETYVHPLLDLYSKIDCIRVVVKSLISGTSNQQLTFSDQETRCLGSMITALINRVFFTTRTRYIGIAPRSTAPGDEVCVILGCNTAMILRPTTDESQKRVVGPCYIEGFSHGEAVLGPLPSGVKRKLLYKGGSYRYIFGDGELLDPRLKDWR